MICENWLKWCLDKYNYPYELSLKQLPSKEQYILGEDIVTHTDKIHISESDINYNLNVYYVNNFNNIHNKYLIWDKNNFFNCRQSFRLNVNDKELIAIRTHEGSYTEGWIHANAYLVDVVDGDYYYDDDWLFTSNEGLRSSRFVEDRIW